MKAGWVLAAVAAAGSAWAQEQQAPSARHPQAPVITNPDWERKPGPDDFSNYYPAVALSEGQSGRVSIECDVTATGAVVGCVVLSESPEGEGFGQAALKISRYFKMKPKTLDGKPVGGGIFRTRIQFSVDEQPPIPDWVRRPSQQEILAVWPEQARRAKGNVVLDCDTDAKGRPRGCSIYKESPRGLGFGKAALKLAQKIELTGSYQTGVLIPISFVPDAPSQNGAAEYGQSLSAMTSAPWKTAPVSADLAAAWPKAAPADLQEAQVRLSCGFTADGKLDPCTILSEEPPGLGFGAAALSLASRFSLRTGAADPEQLKKARVILPITFENPALRAQAPAIIEKPNWVTFIDQQRMVELYPAKAADAGVKTGRGVVVCTVAAGGGLTNCTVESEDPPGLDFGPAAVAVLTAFTVNPWTEDGHPVDGAKLRVPVRMNQAEQEAAPPPQAPPAPKPGG
jgi:TonB family protein